MSLFTIVMDYRGGTYIRQVRAKSPLIACRKWAKNLEASSVFKLGASGKADLIAELNSEKLEPYQKLTNAWCICAIARGQLAVVNIVKTDQTIDEL